jgi:hypothetical protein
MEYVMTRIKVTLVYDTYGTVYVDLPEGVDPDSISRIDVKWENGEITLDDNTVIPFDATCDDWYTDYKDPSSINHEVDDD